MDEKDNAAPEPTQKRKKKRSPSFPFINLEAAVTRAEQLYALEGDLPVAPEVAVQHWDYSTKSSGGKQTLAALKAFGLLERADGRVRLSGLGLDIVVEGSPRRQAALQEAAIQPDEFNALWQERGGRLSAGLRFELVRHRGFNENSVDDFIQNYRDTIAFAGLQESDKLGGEQEDSESESRRKPRLGDLVQWESQGAWQFETPRKLVGFSDDELWAFVEGSATGLPVSELTVQQESREETAVPTPQLKSESPPPANPFFEVPASPSQPFKEDVFTLDSGNVVLRWPVELTGEEFEDLKAWLGLMQKKVGRSVVEE